MALFLFPSETEVLPAVIAAATTTTDSMQMAPDLYDWAAAKAKLKEMTGVRCGSITEIAAFCGYIELLAWVHRHGCSLNRQVAILACMKDSPALLEYLYSQRVPFEDLYTDITNAHCDQFMCAYSGAWKSGRFDVPLHSILYANTSVDTGVDTSVDPKVM